MPTKKNTGKSEGGRAKNAPIHDLSRYMKDGSLDQLLTDMCLNSSVGEVVMKREGARIAKVYFLADLICSAIFEQDMVIVNQIINRIDGTTPTTDTKEQYANLTGMAIADVMELEQAEQLRIMPEDPAIIGIAKAIYVIAVSHPRIGSARRKDKQLAIDIILNRVGGKKTEPVKPLIESRYVDPEWMRQLEEAKDDKGHESEDEG